MSDDDGPVLPYGTGEDATGGHSGSDASRQRAERERDSGVLSRRQGQVLDLVRASERYGVTYMDVCRALHLHHGQASGALSNLHKAGKITRLTEQRGRCQIYVTADNVAGREVTVAGRKGNPVMRKAGDDLMYDLIALVAFGEHDTIHPSETEDPDCLFCGAERSIAKWREVRGA